MRYPTTNKLGKTSLTPTAAEARATSNAWSANRAKAQKRAPAKPVAKGFGLDPNFKPRRSAYGSNQISAPSKKQPTANPTTQQSYTAKSTIQKPRYISDEATQDSVNNTLAQGYANANERFQTKSLDRAGLSRGAGQQFMAGQEGVKKMQEAAGSAADVQASDQRTNDQMRSDYQKASEQEAQNNAMIQHQLAQTSWQQQFAQQSLNAQLQMAQEQAMLQLRLALFR